VLDGRLDSGWASEPGARGPARIDIALGGARVVAGVTVVVPKPETLPSRLAAIALDHGREGEILGAVEPRGLTVTWAGGAPRVFPGHALTLRFPATLQRGIRLLGSGPAAGWRVSELFVLLPAPGAVAPGHEAVEAVRTLEAAAGSRETLPGYLRIMRAEPDEPAAYAEAARLARRLGLPLAAIDAEADRLVAAARAAGPGRPRDGALARERAAPSG
jgi:hypothetical protein